jgi:NAD(P) transhydrogenase subunit alpha
MNDVRVGIPKETFPDERRVALTPRHAKTLIESGLSVYIEAGSGTAAGFLDTAYLEAGAQIIESRVDLFQTSNVILQVKSIGTNKSCGDQDFDLITSDHIVIGLNDPLAEFDLMNETAKLGAKIFSLEMLPRITRAQSMDVLSSMAMIAGYKSVLLAADTLPKMFPMMMTAAGTITPSRVFIVGAGVAGLQAIASARRLGAVVQAYDIRPIVKEQVESLGAKFVEFDLDSQESEGSGGYAKEMDEEFYRKQREMMNTVIAESDVVITTAAVPGRKAPILVTEEMVSGMRPGSVIVDLAAERGGNCELTKPGQDVEINGVLILGPSNLPSMIPYHASEMYSKNISTFLLNMIDSGKIELNLDDEIVRETLVTSDGKVVHQRVRELLKLDPIENVVAEGSGA